MTKEEIAELAAKVKAKLIALQTSEFDIKHSDKEGAHTEADNLLVELLTALGYGDIVKEWKAVDKWYS